MESDQAAHNGDALPPILEQELVPTNPPQLITDAAALGSLLDELRTAGSFGYDSEFIGEHTYYPHICVIQVATAERVSLIDTLQGLDLTPFWQLLADEGVEKIVHAGMQDLEPVLRHTGRPPRNIFDVQIAGAFAGMLYPSSLSRIVKELAGADINPGAKFSQWDRRPLSPVQMQYAANDVRYLPLLRSTIGEKLKEHGNTRWALAECATLEDPELYQVDPAKQRVRAAGVAALGPRRRAVLQELLRWRDELARSLNRPPRSVVPDPVLFDLARFNIKTADDLERIRGLSRPIKQHHSRAILELIQNTRATHTNQSYTRRRSMRDIEIDRDRVNALWLTIAGRAAARNIHPAVVTSKKELTRFIYADELGRSRQDMRLCHGWRAELLAGIVEQYQK